jgi:phospholipid/cholesterol/gamma-HCH transport system substrate-binding protein
MTKRYGELQIGITVLIAAVVLIFGVIWFQGFTARTGTLELTVYFPQVSGLDKGDPVEVAGVSQGKVKEMKYEKGRARLVLALDKDTDLYRNTRIRIANFGMMGQKFVAIDPGTPSEPPLDTSKPLIGEYEASIADMMSGAGRTVATMETLAVRITNLVAELDSAGGGAAIGRTIENMEQLSADLAELSRSSKTDIQGAVKNFNAGSRELKSLLADKGPQLRGTIDNFASSSARMDSLTIKLSEVSRNIHALVDQARNPDGNVGALLKDRDLYERLLGTVARTDSLIADVKRNPRRYFKFSVF